jgi:hypothetical protein
MRKILIAIIMFTVMLVSSQEVVLQKKIKSTMTRFDIHHDLIGLRLQKKDKTIKKIKFYYDNKLISERKEELFINSFDIKYIELPPGCNKVFLQFTSGTNNVLYVYKKEGAK